MDRVEEKAREAYPVISNGPFTDILLKERNAYINGYIQAEKDLIEKAVTWWSNNLVESEPIKGHYISAFKKYMENK